MTGSFTLDLTRNPALNKLQSGYVGANTLTINGSGFGTGPTVVLAQDYTSNTVGAVMPQGVWDAATLYPKYYSVGGVVGMGSRNNNLTNEYNITVQQNTVYKITVSGFQANITSATSGATATSIVAQLVAAINSDTNNTAIASGTTTLILSRKTPSVPFSVYGATDTGNWTASTTVDARTTLVKSFANTSSYFAAWQMGVPDGYYFSGATAEHTHPNASTLKMLWLTDGGVDAPELADMVAMSRNSQYNWATVGNQGSINLNQDPAFSFNTVNGFISTALSGASPFIDNGFVANHITTAAGTNSRTVSPAAPVFIALTTLIITVQSLATYTVTIGGTPCTPFVSGASATLAQIQAGIISSVNSSGLGVTCAVAGAGVDLVLTPTIRTNPTITLTSNLAKISLAPQYNKVDTHWQGNNNQAQSLCVFPRYYLAIGNNAGNAVCITDNIVFGNSTIAPVFAAPTLYTDTQIQAVFSDNARIGRPYWHRWFNGVVVESGVL